MLMTQEIKKFMQGLCVSYKAVLHWFCVGTFGVSFSWFVRGIGLEGRICFKEQGTDEYYI